VAVVAVVVIKLHLKITFHMKSIFKILLFSYLIIIIVNFLSTIVTRLYMLNVQPHQLPDSQTGINRTPYYSLVGQSSGSYWTVLSTSAWRVFTGTPTGLDSLITAILVPDVSNGAQVSATGTTTLAALINPIGLAVTTLADM